MINVEVEVKKQRHALKVAGVSGAWDYEPDLVQFSYLNYPCVLFRSSLFLNWCGYAGVTPDHPFYGKNYDQVEITVHGGVTFSDKCQSLSLKFLSPEEPDNLWWFGFDCAHFGDLLPLNEMYRTQRASERRTEVYRDQYFVERECRKLARQLRKVGRA